MIHAAAQRHPYACFVRADTRIPFMAMPDAVAALVTLLEAPADALTSHVYNVTAFSPTAGELAHLVGRAFPHGRVTFAPDPRRQAIVDSWPEDVDDARARRDWGFRPAYDLDAHVRGVPGAEHHAALRARVDGRNGEHVRGDRGGRLQTELDGIREAGLWKDERIVQGPQGARVAVGGHEVLNFCANNYLGLASEPALVRAAQDGLARWGFGLASVRFICGTQTIHKELEAAVARFLGTEDAILYTSCFDANGGLFETLLDEPDVVISDALNHASIIDGIRLCRARRERYAHADMADLERILAASAGARTRLIATDGVFSMDGDVAPLGRICELADRYDALVMVDDSHATGFFGPTGRGTPEHCGVAGRVDIITSTLGKALGGASGGFTASRAEVVALLRQRSRPYLFSNTLPPALVCSALACLARLSESTALRDRLAANTRWFRQAMTEAGFGVRPGEHPIVPIMLGDARLAHRMAADLFDEGIYVVGFSYPVVPRDKARIRVQVSAAHEPAHLERAVAAFVKVGRAHGVI